MIIALISDLTPEFIFQISAIYQVQTLATQVQRMQIDNQGGDEFVSVVFDYLTLNYTSEAFKTF